MKEPPIIIEKEKFLGRCVELVGRERQYVSVIAVLFFSGYLCNMLFHLRYSIAVLFFSGYLCNMLFYLRYSTCDYFCGCHCCDFTWMPHLGNILELTPICLKKMYTFRTLLSKDSGLCLFAFALTLQQRILFGKLYIYCCVVKSLK